MGSVDLKTKLTQLTIAVKRTSKILESGKREPIKRHLETLQTVLKETNECKRTEELKKISEDEEISNIDEWNAEIEGKLEDADNDVLRLEEWLEERERKEKFVAQEELFKLELEMHERKLKMQAELSKPTPEIKECGAFSDKAAKLPKLVISKFDGSFMDWPRFWGQFSEAIDKSSIAPISKLTYLLELLVPKVKRSIEALPFTAEGYNRAKAVLEDKYGKDSEIVKCYVREILDLPYITSANPRKIAEFYDKLTHSVQALETMKRLNEINGNVALTLDKLSGIRGDLVRADPDWETWDFLKLTEALRQWVKRNPVGLNEKERDEPSHSNRRKLFNARSENLPKGCVYCGDLGHKAAQCEKVINPVDRKGILAKKGLCFNCATKQHRAAECTSKTACSHCNKRHHSSICDQVTKSEGNKKLMTDGVTGEGILPVVVVEVNGVKCRALIDSGASSSYASAKLIDLVNTKPNEIIHQRVDMLLSSQTTRLELSDAKISSGDGSFEMTVRLSKVDKSELLSIANPEYGKLIARYQHLKTVRIDDCDTKKRLPIHVVLGCGEYARIKTSTKPLIGGDLEPVAEKTKYGWTIMSPGVELDKRTMLLTQTSQADFDNLCRLDVLGLEDTVEHDQDTVYEEFKDQLVRNPAGWYETNLPWKSNHLNLPTNERGSLRRLDNLVKRLKRNECYQDYDDVIKDQLEKGVVEPAPTVASGKEFYIPHKPVVKQTAETTKLRIVYDASAKESNTQPSLNDCLNPGPSLQNLLWSILVRSRFFPVLLTGDLEKAFLQVRIKEEERDALRFHWKSPGSDVTTIYRFTRALFGLTCSPFLLGGVLNEHLKSWKDRYPSLVKELLEGLYVDDLMMGGANAEEVREKQIKAIEVFQDATFKLHKWHSNVVDLERTQSNPSEELADEDQSTFAKRQLGHNQTETKLLGLPWNKSKDTLVVVTVSQEPATTKRSALSQLAGVYDPLGLISPTTLLGKLLYRSVCEAHLPWDSEFPNEIQQRWGDWCLQLPQRFEVPRSLAPRHQTVTAITLHAFGDASKKGVSAVVYAVVEQEEATTQGLVCAKARLAKQNLTIPRLELVAGHMAVNLVTNVEVAVGVETIAEIHCWLDSTVALFWINGQGEYRQFVANRVKKIREHGRVTWHHVPTKENPADLGSRGGTVIDHGLWQHGPRWLSDKSKWPPEVILESSPETEIEAKSARGSPVLATVSQPSESDVFDKLLEAHPLRKTLRVCAWIQRFLRNCRTQRDVRDTGPLKTREIEERELWWIKRAQLEAEKNQTIEKSKIELNLQANETGVFQCRGRIEGEYPIYLPRDCVYTQKVVEQAHLTTLHGGVSTTMTKVRERFWVPKIRQLVKRVRSQCWGCKRFRVKAFEAPPPAPLPSTRTQGSTPFEVVGVDFAGPIRYKKGKSDKKAYLALFACSLCRAVHLELTTSLEASEFIAVLKKFIARRGRPRLIYSDNGSTFKATKSWLKQVEQDERLNAKLAEFAIEWRFNLSRAPWWGGQFERLIGLFKRSFYKTIGNGNLSFEELEEVVLDVETALNDRPLSYVEDDVELPALTPHSMMHINPCCVPELEPHRVDDGVLRKRAKLLKKCKEHVWKRWSKEYVRGLREQHRRKATESGRGPKIGEAVIVYDGEEKNRNKWRLAIVAGLITGRDGTVRGAKLKTAKGTLERAIQHLFPLELSCDETPSKRMLNPNANEFKYSPRRKRNAAAVAELRIQDEAEEDKDNE